MSKYRNHQIERFAALFAALGNPHRLRVFLKLAACCPPGTACCDAQDMSRCVGEIAQGLKIAPATLSHHLKELQAAGAIRCSRRGRNIDCCIDLETVNRLAAFFGGPVPAKAAAPNCEGNCS
ncbi:MAG: ArsR/SmtB family transcription factor [Phycisphaerales bacterium]